MNQEKATFYELLFGSEEQIKQAIALLNDQKELQTVIEAELLPILGKKNLKTLPTFIKNKEKLLKKALLKDSFNHWKNCPALLSSFTSLKITKKENTLLPLFLAQYPTHLSNITALQLVIAPDQTDNLSEWLGQLTALTSLSLTASKLTDLPTALWELKQLTTLELGNNNLIHLPEEVGRLTQLTTLAVQSNKLVSLPKSLDRLTQLTTLNLARNQLTELPEALGKLTQLTTLELQSNKLEALP